jgi:ribosomal protein S20
MKKETTREEAFHRAMQNKAGKAELKTLIKWADKEIEEWQSFREVCKKRLTPNSRL